MFKGDNYNQESNQKHSFSKDEISIRPISAVNKRPDTFKFHKTNVRKTEFPNLFSHVATGGFSNDTSKAKSISKHVEKERLYDDNINLKAMINNFRKDNTSLKSQINLLETEMGRKDKAIEDINYDIQSSHFSGTNTDVGSFRGKETSLIMNLKKQIKEVTKEVKSKNGELETLRKNVRITKLNELDLDVTVLREEVVKVKRFLEIANKNNHEKDRYLNDYIMLKEVFTKQQNQLGTLSEKSRKLDEDIKLRDGELNTLAVLLKEKDTKIIRLTKEFKEQVQLSEKVEKEAMDLNAASHHGKLSALQKMVDDLRKDIYFFKTEAEKKEKRVRELESVVKSKPGFSTAAGQTSFRDVKSHQPAEERVPLTGEALKAKFQLLAKEKEDLELQNKKLSEKINFYENKQDISNHMNTNPNNQNNVMMNNNNDVNNQEMKTNELVNNNADADAGEENKENPNNQEEENLDEEELNNYLFNEDQFKEFTYILIKNFEAQRLDLIRLTRIFQEIDQNTDEIILSELAGKIADALGIKNQVDQTKILIYINTLLIYSGSDYDSFKQKFLTLFDSVSSFPQNQQDVFKKQLVKKLQKHIDNLNDQIKKFDRNETGFITFQQLRKILDSINISLDDELVEFLIYLMKSFTNDENTTLEDLRYSNIVNLIPSTYSEDDNQSKHKSESDNKENIVLYEEEKMMTEKKEDVSHNKGSTASLNNENPKNERSLKQEDSEVVITTNQFNKILEGIFMKIAEHLLTNKKTARTHFNSIIYSHELNNEVYEAIPLQYLLDSLEKINIKLDTIGIHCVYEKLKYSDDYESIDVAKLVEELENYGIFETTMQTQNAVLTNRETSEEFLNNLNNYLKEKKVTVMELLNEKVGVSKEGEMLINVDDFQGILYNHSVTKNRNIPKSIIKEICKENDTNFINLSVLKMKLGEKSSERVEKEKDQTPEKPNDSKIKTKESKKEKINLSNDIPEADSKLFNETLNGEQQKENEKNQEDNSLLQLEKELEEEEKKRELESNEKKETNKD